MYSFTSFCFSNKCKHVSLISFVSIPLYFLRQSLQVVCGGNVSSSSSSCCMILSEDAIMAVLGLFYVTMVVEF